MHSTAAAPFQLYPALCTVLQLLHSNSILTTQITTTAPIQ